MTPGRADGGRPPASGGSGPDDGGAAPADGGFRLFPSDLDDRQRRVYRAVLVFFLAATAALVWPLYAAFGGGIRPTLLGIPFSLSYVIVWVVASFLVLLGLYLWEGRRADGGPPGPDAGPAPPERGPADTPEGRAAAPPGGYRDDRPDPGGAGPPPGAPRAGTEG